MKIREFCEADAQAISDLIIENLKKVNICDYSKKLMDALAEYKSPQQLLRLSQKWDTFVAENETDILGVVMLDKNKIKTMFVSIQAHDKGIGRSLLDHIEALARERKLSRVCVDSSITAVGFYAKCGYRPIRKLNKPFRNIDNVVFEMMKIL